jgi:PadR family transcriptional regulator, regulatory protein PadR
VETILSARAALLLALDLPGYGLELIERLRRLTSGRTRLGPGSVYPALNRLEREGLVRSRAVRARGAGRPTKYFELTARGVAVRRAERDALLGLLRAHAGAGPATDPARARQRLERCAAVSDAAVELRRRVLARTARG